MNKRWVRESRLPTATPFINLRDLAFLRHLLKPSVIRKNKYGDNENPCLRPLEGLKKGMAEPIIKTAI